jgi:hypothetical protein
MRPMPKLGDTMRVMAEKYLKLAKATPDPQERKKFLDYAALYAQMSARSVNGDEPTAAEDKSETKREETGTLTRQKHTTD